MFRLTRIYLSLAIWGACWAALRADDGNTPTASAKVDYRKHIAPLLSKHCFRCHGEKSQEGGLRLDVRQRALTGGDSGLAIQPGNSKQSAMIARVASNDPEVRMPPEGARLLPAEVELLKRWIDQGAKGIPDGRPSSSNHWAFQSIKTPAIPDVADSNWCSNAIDRFVLAKLENEGIKPSPSASPRTLVRRLYLDLIGLPPTWRQIESFMNDESADAYERLVDKLLASAHYGERWGRHWLDLARHADSGGYEADMPRETWAYRDYVINAFNSDMPFDRFVVEQLGGDLLPIPTMAQRIATGFHCNAMYDPGVRFESVIDQVNTTGTVFLGLTVGCAQCHTHKTDPITQREFYGLYGFFNNAIMMPMDLATGKPAIPPTEKTKVQPPSSLIMKYTAHPTHIFLRGDPAQPGEQVAPGFPAELDWQPAKSWWGELDGSPSRSVKNRLDLARWIVSDKNPLTDRVTVNRIWQRFFGLGLVSTEDDFGVQTPPPSHPELLDWLAREFRRKHLSFKSLHRLIVTSSTYRQVSVTRSDLSDIDPGNRFLARQRRLRLEGEIVRDVWMYTGDLLSEKMGGPSVFPWQPESVLENRATPAKWIESKGENRYRRGLYTWFWRLTPHPHFPLLDGPDAVTACTRRGRSNVPVQALTLLNDPTFMECARKLATLVVAMPSATDRQRLDFLYHRCLGRDPISWEIAVLKKVISDQRRQLATSPKQAEAISDGHESPAEHAVWVIICRAIMNTDEFITRE